MFQSICNKSNIVEEEFKESISLYIATKNNNLYKSMESIFNKLANKKNINYLGK
jgi:hypothetical protein